MTKKPGRPIRIQQAAWASAVLDLRPATLDLPADVPLVGYDVRNRDLIRQSGPNGWALTIWRTLNDPEPGACDVMVIEAPDGERTAVIVTARKPGTGKNPGQALFTLMSAPSISQHVYDLPETIWSLLPRLHAALLNPDGWLDPLAGEKVRWRQAREMLTWVPWGLPVDAGRAWEALGLRTGRAWTTWREAFPDDATIRDWVQHGFDLTGAKEWAPHLNDPAAVSNWRYTSLPKPLAATLIGLGWTDDQGRDLYLALYNRVGRMPAVWEFDEAFTFIRTVHRVGLGAEDVLGLLAAGVSPEEFRTGWDAGTLTMDAVRAMAALRLV